MPHVHRTILWQLGLLLLIVPVQYFVSQHWQPVSSAQQKNNVKKMMTQFVRWKNKIFNKETWKKWALDLQDYVITLKDTAFESTAETADDNIPAVNEEDIEKEELFPKVEILEERNKDGYFAASSEPRNPRPTHVKYKIGQVIRHTVYGYRGVIVGWDARAKAPKDWLDSMHAKNKPHLRYLPNYSVLVDGRDREGAQVTYIVEENIEIIKGHEVQHPKLKDYFHGFDGAQYIAKPWLAKIYPNDK